MDSFATTITRVAPRHWQALDSDREAGRTEASPRPDGRLFLSIDSWHAEVFDRLAATVLADLPVPLYTVVDEADHDLISSWKRAGFTISRRDWDYHLPTDPAVTGLDPTTPPTGVVILDHGAAEADPLAELDRALRAESGTALPVEVLCPPLDPSTHVVAAHPAGYVGLCRVQRIRVPRIGLVAVRAGARRRGIARALLAQALGALHGSGIEFAYVEVSEANTAATALFRGLGARPLSSCVEMVRR
ncbi:GNAT family N-acetyltransferase [Nocardia sp. NPDC051832]|uniref:GNAT family N-acetyltransferase n=1 Tax=Nocardia sp. NPDC051832 TaxID=3155673 RepID=UPI003412CAF1